LKDFENFILDSAVKNSEVWWGESMSREVAKHTFFPFIKYSRNKDTKKIDLTKPPSIRAKVPFYDGRWNTEIYNIKSQLIYPADDNTTPMDHIPSRSNVACILQCGGIWIGGKGWGLTWKLFQCVVKNNHSSVPVKGICAVHIPKEELETESNKESAAAPSVASVVPSVAPSVVPSVGSVAPVVASAPLQKKPVPVISAEVEDSDTEEEPVVPPPAPTPTPTPVLAPEPVAPTPTLVQEEPVAKKVVKKVVKKST
jgi:hypothetical protein